MAFSEQEQEEFKSEALELLELAEKSLLSLDEGADYRPAFDAVFRGFHNLKGAAGMMELSELQNHTHRLEDILMQFKEATGIPKEYVSLFLKGIDAARTILDGKSVVFDFAPPAAAPRPSTRSERVSKEPSLIEPAPPTEPESQLVPHDSSRDEFVTECEEIVDRVSDLLQIIEGNTHNRSHLESLYRDIHSLKGSAYLFGCQTLGDIAHAMESSLEGVREGSHQPTGQLLNALFQCLEVIEKEAKALMTQSKIESVEAKVAPLIQDLINFGKVLPMTPTPAPASLPPQAVPLGQVTPPSQPKQDSKDGESASTIRVPVALLDNLMTLMGEMVLVRNQVLQFSSKSEDLEFLNLSKRLNVVTSEIQGEMMKTRMQPIGNVLNKFSRVVRDLSHELKKEITLNIQGADTELDKSLLESIKDPLTHIVRNSCDHGIETPEVRTQAGKDRQGTITIRSYHEGGQVVIEISDDGKGLQKETLLQKGLEKGLITQSQASAMNEKEIYGLIFAPGFSTAQSVTNVSGRGVGMDVVRTNVERIGGSVELTSQTGLGTTIKLKIPLTLAIVPALIVRSAGETFAVPQVKLEELVRVEANSPDHKIEYLHGAPVYRLRGNILPLVSLNRILGRPESPDLLSTASNIAVLNADQCSFGLLVDSIQDTADIVVKPLNRLLKSLQVYSGATILGDGSIALILDVLGIAKIAQIAGENSKDAVASKQTADRRNTENQDLLIVRVQSPTKHAIILNSVHRLEEFKIKDIEFSGSQKVIRYGETILPLIWVSETLGYSPTTQTQEDRHSIPVVVIQKAGRLYGLVVDEIVDTLSTDLEVDSTFRRQPGIFGNLNLPSELIVAIDPFEIIELAFPEAKVSPAGEVSHGKASSGTTKTQSLKVLLVEDTVFFRRAIASVLESAGHKITRATDGREALEILEQNPDFDLIVSDIEMPRVNGFELAKAIRANKRLKDIPLLALSSRADKRHMEEGMRSGFDVYLEKLKPTLLLDAVSTLSDARRAA